MPEATKAYAELQIGIERLPAGAYQVELRFTDPEDDAEKNPVKGETQFDTGALLKLERRPKEYGQALASMLLGDKAVRSEYSQIMASVEPRSLSLRIRLLIGLSAPEMHSLRWELLTAPGGAHLFTTERVLFSRFMTSQDWRSVRLRRKAQMRALIAVAAPSDLEEKGLAKIDRSAEIANAAEHLGGIDRRVAAKDQPLTLASLIEALREPVDILYLVCHGALSADGPWLFLESDDGKLAKVKGQDLADRLNDLPHQPRLVVLASCESAGTTGAEVEPGHAAFHSLAPLLAAAGVPAVFAMRGKIGIDTVRVAMPVFFRELVADGQIDRAMGAARAAAVLHNCPDFWMMALYMRLRGGRLWYEPGFREAEDFAKWESIVNHVRKGRFVAVLGAGVGESIFGDPRNLARRLAEAEGFPLASYLEDDLPQVLQYIEVKHDRPTMIAALRRQLRDEVLRQHGHRMPAELQKRPLKDLLDFVMEPSQNGPKNPYQILAGLRGKVYLSATPDLLMWRALVAEKKKPTRLYTRWRQTEENIPKAPAFDGRETEQTPVVYQMLGLFGKDEYAPECDSLVLTENDYFDYTISAVKNRLVPQVVSSALVENSLLFLGFQLTDWSFRVLFRLIHSLGGSKKSENLNMSHVGVQVNPDEFTLTDVKEARQHLERYFRRANIALFWGSAEDFLKQLQERIDAAPVLEQEATPAEGGEVYDA